MLDEDLLKTMTGGNSYFLRGVSDIDLNNIEERRNLINELFKSSIY